MITLVTTTRDRPLCFSLLEKWIERQTVQPDEWIVVNDGTTPYSYANELRILNRNPSRDTLPSICENWLGALQLIRNEKVIVAEDDDWLHPEYVATISKMLDDVDLAGVRDDLYWKIRSRKFIRMHNKQHASLGATGFRASMLGQIERCCTTFKSVFIDMYLWGEAIAEGTPYSCALQPNKASDGRALHVGLKQMPGAKGLGIGHNEDGSTDPNFQILAKWIGPQDASIYRRLWGEHFGNTTFRT